MKFVKAYFKAFFDLTRTLGFIYLVGAAFSINPNPVAVYFMWTGVFAALAGPILVAITESK